MERAALSYSAAKHMREELEGVKEEVVHQDKRYRAEDPYKFDGYTQDQMAAYHTTIDELVSAAVEKYGHIEDLTPQVRTSSDSDELAYCQERDTSDEIARAQNMLEHLQYIRERPTATLDDLEHPHQSDGWDESTIETYLRETYGDSFSDAFDQFETNEDVRQHVRQITAGEDEPDAYTAPNTDQLKVSL